MTTHRSFRLANRDLKWASHEVVALSEVTNTSGDPMFYLREKIKFDPIKTPDDKMIPVHIEVFVPMFGWVRVHGRDWVTDLKTGDTLTLEPA